MMISVVVGKADETGKAKITYLHSGKINFPETLKGKTGTRSSVLGGTMNT